MKQQAARHILLVEDHADTARAMAKLLDLSGYHVSTANSVQAAVDLCSRQQFDLLISDVGLPDGSGYDLMRTLNERQGSTKGIAVSGYGSEKDIYASRQAGFLEHLVKPVSFDTLTDAISRIIPE